MGAQPLSAVGASIRTRHHGDPCARQEMRGGGAEYSNAHIPAARAPSPPARHGVGSSPFQPRLWAEWAQASGHKQRQGSATTQNAPVASVVGVPRAERPSMRCKKIWMTSAKATVARSMQTLAGLQAPDAQRTRVGDAHRRGACGRARERRARAGWGSAGRRWGSPRHDGRKKLGRVPRHPEATGG